LLALALPCTCAVLQGCEKPPVEQQESTVLAYDPARDPLVNPSTLFQPAPEDLSQIATDDVLYLNLDGSPQNLNPIFASSAYEFVVNDLLFDGPFLFDDKMEWALDPEWVESYAEAEDHLSAILRLRPGLRWHDDVPITAHDIVYSWKSIIDERVPCPAVKTGTVDVIDCIALDDLTVKYVHKEAVPTAKWNVFFPVIPKHLYEKDQGTHPDLKTGDYYSELNRKPIGSGPYKILDWIANDRIILERWEDYPGPKPYYRQIICRLIADQNAKLLSFEKGETDCVRVNEEQFAKQTNTARFAKAGYKLVATEWAFGYICWNMDGSNRFFSDVRVRHAMTHALNIPLIIEKVFHNLSQQCNGIYHPDSWMYNSAVQLLPYDLPKAAALLDEAGWLVDPQDGWRYKGTQGQRVKFEFTLQIPLGATSSEKIANFFQEDLRSIGVDMKTRTLEWATFMEVNRRHEFQAFIAGWGTGTDPDTGWNLWRTEEYKTGRNYGGYSSPRVDELFAMGRREFDFAKRKKIYQEIHKLIYDDQPYTFIYYRPSLYAVEKRIRGIQTSPRGIFNFDPSVRAWWTKSGERSQALEML